MLIDAQKIFQDRLADSIGIKKYAYIVNTVNEVDVSVDANFQRIYDGFYIVRRNSEWRKAYFDLFEQIKNEEDVSFEFIIRELNRLTGNIEPSFSSKMLASINMNKPIWDKYVLVNLGIVPKTSGDRLTDCIEKYKLIENWYLEFLSSENARECVQIFNSYLPDYSWISDTKKIDYFLWGLR